MANYSFGSLTDKYIFAEPHEIEKLAFQKKEGISTVGYKRRKWLDHLPGKLSSRIEEIDWSTGNQGTLRFFIKLPNALEEVDRVKMLGTQQEILASIPYYALKKSVAYARDLFNNLFPSANRGVRSKLIRILTNDSRSPEGNAKIVQMRLDDFFATGTVYLIIYYIVCIYASMQQLPYTVFIFLILYIYIYYVYKIFRRPRSFDRSPYFQWESK